MKKTIKILIFIILSCYFKNTFAYDIYISPKGNDKNHGTKDSPLASLTGARNKIRELRKQGVNKEPINVIIADGVYQLNETLILSIEDSGTPESPITYKAEENASPTFIGGIYIKDFTKVNDYLWKAYIPEVVKYNWYFEQLYVNDKRATRAKSPNNGFYYIKDINETIIDKGNNKASLLAVQRISMDSNDAKCLQSFTLQDKTDAVVRFNHKWDNTIKHIQEINIDNSAFYTSGTGMKPWNTMDKKTRFVIENYKAALDTAGEWFLDRNGELFYIPLNGETIENSTFIAPIAKYFIVIKGNETDNKKVEFINFSNLNFQVAAYTMPVNGFEPAQAAATIDAVVMLDFAKNISFNNCEIAHTGTYAFWFNQACSNCDILHCYMHDLGAGGVKIGETIIRENNELLTHNIKVDNNIITDGGHVFPCAVGIIIFNASDNTLSHNEISDLRYSGISVGWVWGYKFSPSKRNRIEYNHIHHIGWGELCDMGGVYTLGASEGTVVANNVIHHVLSYDYGGWGLYTDEGSYGIIMENNLVYACKNSGFHQHYGKENIIRNNIFALNMIGQLQATRIEDHQSFSFTNNIVYFSKGNLLLNNWSKIRINTDLNCYWDTRINAEIKFGDLNWKEWKNQGKDINSIISDPMFVNPTAYDFRFKNKSIVNKIKFQIFDYSKAGVYGSPEWIKLSALSSEKIQLFDKITEKLVH